MLLNIYTRGPYLKCNVIKAFIYNFNNPNFDGFFGVCFMVWVGYPCRELPTRLNYARNLKFGT